MTGRSRRRSGSFLHKECQSESRWPVFLLLCALASLLVPGIAASMASGAEIRVWACDLADQVHVGVERSLTPELHQGCTPTYDQRSSDSLLAARGGGRAVDAALDATGKVHGKLPDVKDLGRYDVDELARLRHDLTQSVQKRIEVTVQKGSDFGHGERLATEQQLIKSIEKHLKDR